jgi:hypothetical protein
MNAENPENEACADCCRPKPDSAVFLEIKEFIVRAVETTDQVVIRMKLLQQERDVEKNPG